ncbi:MAG: Mur ligase family protein [Bacilli bacterium]
MKYYLVGIKGTGMSSLARILKDNGNYVTGCDISDYFFTQDLLEEYNIQYELIDDFSYKKDFNYIIGNYYKDNAKFQFLFNKKNTTSYINFLSDYIKNKYSIAICGTHGKTTTVGLFYDTFKNIINIEMLRGDGIGFGGNKESIVFEACEYKNNFLNFTPKECILTNIDFDHTDFFKNQKAYINSFQKFLSKANKIYIPYEDYKKVKHENIITYGTSKKADYYLKDVKHDNEIIEGKLFHKKEYIDKLILPFYGFFNFIHALSIVAYGLEHNIEFKLLNENLAKFAGVNRRINTTIINGDIYIDDYAHHPNEIKATLKFIKEKYPSLKLTVFFKPDRFSRLLFYKHEFKKALNFANDIYVLPLYERVNKKTSSLLLLNKKFHYLDDLNSLTKDCFTKEKQVFIFLSSKNMNDVMNKVEEIRS